MCLCSLQNSLPSNRTHIITLYFNPHNQPKTDACYTWKCTYTLSYTSNQMVRIRTNQTYIRTKYVPNTYILYIYIYIYIYSVWCVCVPSTFYINIYTYHICSAKNQCLLYIYNIYIYIYIYIYNPYIWNNVWYVCVPSTQIYIYHICSACQIAPECTKWISKMSKSPNRFLRGGHPPLKIPPRERLAV